MPRCKYVWCKCVHVSMWMVRCSGDMQPCAMQQVCRYGSVLVVLLQRPCDHPANAATYTMHMHVMEVAKLCRQVAYLTYSRVLSDSCVKLSWIRSSKSAFPYAYIHLCCTLHAYIIYMHSWCSQAEYMHSHRIPVQHQSSCQIMPSMGVRRHAAFQPMPWWQQENATHHACLYRVHWSGLALPADVQTHTPSGPDPEQHWHTAVEGSSVRAMQCCVGSMCVVHGANATSFQLSRSACMSWLTSHACIQTAVVIAQAHVSGSMSALVTATVK